MFRCGDAFSLRKCVVLCEHTFFALNNALSPGLGLRNLGLRNLGLFGVPLKRVRQKEFVKSGSGWDLARAGRGEQRIPLAHTL